MNTGHVKGKPYSQSTYQNHKCRCARCRKAHTQAVLPANRVRTRALTLAANFVRQHHPGIWDELMDQAYAERGVERKPVGRPRITNTNKQKETHT